MAGSNGNKADGEPINRGPRPTELPKPEKLPPALRRIVDQADADESIYDELYDGT